MKLTDITNEMLNFKEASRHLWNVFLVPSGSASIPLIQTFEVIERELLREMVLRKLEKDDDANNYRNGPMTGISVQAREYLTELSVQYGSIAADENVRWSDPLATSVGKLRNLEFFDFFDFFDWNPYERRDFSYVRVVDAETGQFCLVQSCDVAFKLIEPQQA